MILGLILLLACIVLFVPFRYQVQGECKGKLNTLRGKIRFSWLLHLLDGTVTYQEGKADWSIRIAWKRITSDLEEQSAEEEEVTDRAEEDGNVESSDRESEISIETVDIESSIPMIPMETETDSVRRTFDSDKEEKNTVAIIEAPAGKNNAGEKVKSQKQKEESTAPKTRKEKKESRISGIIEKIKYTFKKICGTISSLKEKKNKIVDFLTDEVHQSAFRAAFKEVKKLLFRLRPKRLEGRVHYGFEDPSLTGYVLAAASMMYPLIGEQTEIWPDFENKVLEGEVNVVGKIRTVYAVIMGWNLIWNKNVRTTFKHIRKFKL